MKFCRSSVGLVQAVILASVLFGIVGLVCRPAPAQNAAKKFDEIRSDDAYRTFKLKLNPVLERGDFESKEEEDAFVDYYTRFSLPHWTQQKFYSEQKSLPALRKEMHDNLVMSDRHTPKRVHDRLNELVLEFLGDVANNRNPLDNSAADFAHRVPDQRHADDWRASTPWSGRVRRPSRIRTRCPSS